MRKPPTTATELLTEKARKDPHEFPGRGSDEDNAKKYVDALALLSRICKPHYETAAQASLMSDIHNLFDQIEAYVKTPQPSKEVTAPEVLQKLRDGLFAKLRYLNGHGPEHVRVVDKRSFTLVSECAIGLSPYETFFLCASLTIHDAGLIFGRDGHELSIHAILSDLGDKFATKSERNAVERIASAHGGHVPGDQSNRATIDSLNATEQMEGKEIRPQLIAAIVRLADELAEDHTRYAPISGESQEQRKKRLSGSEIFHVYSNCLEPCLIKGQERVVSLQFLLDVEDVVTTFQKGDRERFILEEIYERTEKCFAELLYCGRFMQESSGTNKLLVPNEVRVSIEIGSDNEGFLPLKVGYVHKTRGYPDVTSSGIAVFGTELKASLLEYASKRGIPQTEATELLVDAPKGAAVARLFQRLKSMSQTPDPVAIDEPAEKQTPKRLKNFLKRLFNV